MLGHWKSKHHLALGSALDTQWFLNFVHLVTCDCFLSFYFALISTKFYELNKYSSIRVKTISVTFFTRR